MSAPPLLEARGLRVVFPAPAGWFAPRGVSDVVAVDGVDLLLERGADPNVVDLSGMTALYATVDMRAPANMLTRPEPHLHDKLDALGLVAFTVIGCDIAAATGASLPVVILMGMSTGVFGGLLRDILCNQVPLVLRRDLYATVSLATGVLYMGLLHAGVAAEAATAIAIFVIPMLFVLVERLAAPRGARSHAATAPAPSAAISR